MKPRRLGLRFLLILGLMGLVFGLVGCQSFPVQSDWDREAEFEGLRRFAWEEPPAVEGTGPFEDNGLLRKRIRASVDEILAERGYRAVADFAEADFRVTYHVVLDEKLRVDGVSSVGGGFGGYRRRGLGFGSILSTGDVRSYQESTLVLDVLTAADGELIWRGWASGMLPTRDRERSAAHLNRGVRSIFEGFPPNR